MPGCDQPQLACPACGHSLRGLEPIGPAQLLRCPECGLVTSIGRIAALFVERQRDRQRLPMTIVLAAGLVAVHGLLARQGDRLPGDMQPALGLMFFIGAAFSAWFTIPWFGPAAGARAIAILGGGMIETLAALQFHMRLAFLPTIAWCIVLHMWSRRRGIS